MTDHGTPIRAFLRGGTDPTDDERLRAAVAATRAAPPELPAPQRHEAAYRNLLQVSEAAGPAAALLADRPRLCDLLAWAVIRDPALFHLLLLHYTLFLNGVNRFAPDTLAATEARGAAGIVLLTELGRSSSHRVVGTEARFDPATREFVLHTPDATAVKFPTSAAPTGVTKTALVSARLLVDTTDHGVFTFRVDLQGTQGPPNGVEISPPVGSEALPIGFAAVRFDRARIPLAAWLSDGAAIDADGRFQDPLGGAEARLRRTMSIAEEMWAALVSGGAAVTRAAAAIAVRYSRKRLTGDAFAKGRTLFDYRSQHLPLLSHLADAYALTTLANHANRSRSEVAAGPAVGAWAPWSAVDPLLPLFKAAATEHAFRIAVSCREHCGAPGYLGTPLLAYQNAMHAYRSAGGDNELIRFDTARAMVAGSGYERPQDEAAPAPRDAEALIAVARSLEHRQVALLAERLAAARTADPDEFAVWNGRLPLAAETARLYADRLLMERFAEAAAAAEPEVKERLEPLVELHALSWARRNAAGLLRFGLLTPSDLDALEELAFSWCDRILPFAEQLVDAFDIDTDLVDAPLAADDYLAAFTEHFGFADL